MRLFFFLNIWIYENKDGGRCIPGSADKEQNYWSQTTGKYTLIYKHLYKRKLKIDQQETRSFSPVVGVYITMKTTFYLSFDFQQTIFKLHVYNSKQKAAVNWQLLLVSCYIYIYIYVSSLKAIAGTNQRLKSKVVCIVLKYTTLNVCKVFFVQNIDRNKSHS